MKKSINMPLQKFYIATNDNIGLKEVEAEPIDIAGVKCFIQSNIWHDEDGEAHEYCIISHFSSGMMICSGIGRESMISEAYKRISDCPSVINKAEQILKKHGIKYPVNKL